MAFFNLCHPDDFNQRIVQIGWAVGGVCDDEPAQRTEEYLVKPDGFVISEKATAKHGISTDRTLSGGHALDIVLCKFMETAADIDARGGCIVAHHLEFDAGIIDRELANAGLACWRPQWSAIARKGICTMDPHIGGWVQECMGKDARTDGKKVSPC